MVINTKNDPEDLLATTTLAYLLCPLPSRIPSFQRECIMHLQPKFGKSHI